MILKVMSINHTFCHATLSKWHVKSKSLLNIKLHTNFCNSIYHIWIYHIWIFSLRRFCMVCKLLFSGLELTLYTDDLDIWCFNVSLSFIDFAQVKYEILVAGTCFLFRYFYWWKSPFQTGFSNFLWISTFFSFATFFFFAFMNL